MHITIGKGKEAYNKKYNSVRIGNFKIVPGIIAYKKLPRTQVDLFVFPEMVSPVAFRVDGNGITREVSKLWVSSHIKTRLNIEVNNKTFDFSLKSY